MCNNDQSKSQLCALQEWKQLHDRTAVEALTDKGICKNLDGIWSESVKKGGNVVNICGKYRLGQEEGIIAI
uniref:SCP domain-containing protein n=1 Tax=Rhabditophanes sp. KR3021 TaxID=114890 RepID=A0AC35U3U5_9BILA